MTQKCVSKLSIIGSDNGLSPDRRQAIILTNAGILLIWTLGTNFNEILIEIHTFSFKNFHLKMSSGKWRPFCLGLNVLNHYSTMASQITGVSIDCSTLCSGADQTKHQTSASLAFVRGIHRWPVNSPHKGPVTSGNVENVSIWWRHRVKS